MKIAVFSDTHGHTEAVSQLKKELSDIDAVLHLGDYASDLKVFTEILNVPGYAVRGNCDWWDSDEPTERVVSFDGARILMTHGQQYYSEFQLSLAAEEKCCNAVLFGHTHIPLLSANGPIWILNPGSLSKPRAGSSSGYMLLTVKNGNITPLLCPIK